MPVTRRRRANPPEQPENTNQPAEQPESTVGAAPAPQSELAAPEERPTSSDAAAASAQEDTYQQIFSSQFVAPMTPNGSHEAEHPYNQTIEGGRRTARGELFRRAPHQPIAASSIQSIPSSAAPVGLQPPSHEIKLPLGEKAGDSSGDPLHLAYNPGYTGSDEVRSLLLRKLATETKHGGRARCWGCGSLAVAYECWNTRDRTFGEIGIAYCEICGVWSVM